GLVFCGLGPVWLRSFSSHKTGLPNTNQDKSSSFKGSPASLFKCSYSNLNQNFVLYIITAVFI
ncbi:hypothetical protein K443DRAFT_114480, partial [Laccaria amethystina LaAM-08-1]